MMLLFAGGVYFLIFRPNQKRRRAIEQTQASVAPGAEVLTIGGLYGTVSDVDGDVVTIEVAPGVTNRYARGAIREVVQAPEKPDDSGPSLDKVIDPE